MYCLAFSSQWVCRATQLLTWFMIPFSQGFDDAGDFTILGRFAQASSHSSHQSSHQCSALENWQHHVIERQGHARRCHGL